jgi:hypothetical protein
MRSRWRQQSSQRGHGVWCLSKLWAEELKRQLAGHCGEQKSTGWRLPTTLRSDATTPRSYDGPIGFALDMLSAWHTDLLLSLQFLTRVKAEVVVPSAQGPRQVLGISAGIYQAHRANVEKGRTGSHHKVSYHGPKMVRTGSHHKVSYHGPNTTSRTVDNRYKPKPTPSRQSAKGATPVANPGTYYIMVLVEG